MPGGSGCRSWTRRGDSDSLGAQAFVLGQAYDGVQAVVVVLARHKEYLITPAFADKIEGA